MLRILGRPTAACDGLTRKHSFPNSLPWVAIVTLAVVASAQGRADEGQAAPATPGTSVEKTFNEQVRPLLAKYCLRCHNPDMMKSGVRVDHLNDALEDRHLFLWQGILKQVAEAAMPPEDELQPSDEERRLLVEWIPRAIALARSRNTQKNGSVRRLTVSQYRNTLKDLLGLEEDLTDILPPDALSKDGFSNNGESMVLSPLQVEAYFDIAEQALDSCLVDENARPAIQNFRMDLGAAINPTPCPDKLILGANSLLLNNQDFQVTELTPAKPFDFQTFRMRTAYEFIEGYQGNATVRGWRKYDSIYHSVFACMRGTHGYPKGEPYQAVPAGLLLRPAIPSAELFGQSSTYGPMANFKISLRELPDRGNFRVTVRAARYEDGLLLDAGTATQAPDAAGSLIADLSAASTAIVKIDQAGIYQVDVGFVPAEKPSKLALELGERHFSGQLVPANSQPAAAGADADAAERWSAFLLVRLTAGELKLNARRVDDMPLRRIAFRRLDDDGELAQRFRAFEQRAPLLTVQVGLRRDCGSTLARVGEPLPVSTGELRDYVFRGAINNFPSPDVEKDNVNYLAGVREIGVRSDYTDGREMPRLLIRSVEFEGPFHETWPPLTHRNILFDSDRQDDPAAYAREVLRSFATRAFRRPITEAEEAAIFAVWNDAFAEGGDFLQSIKDALLVVLTSPQFLFLIENSAGPEPEDLDDYELASKLSYFLWNTAPDNQLLTLAAKNILRPSLDAEIERMIRDPRCQQFVREFTSQWLSLDKFDVVEIDRKRYPRLTRDTKTQLRDEPVHFLRYLIEENLPLRNLVQSEFLLANDVVASYYDLADRTESGFQFVPMQHDDRNLGGILSQASILAGLSDGRESNPIKRGAWLARKIIAEPPDDPPPNVPKLPEDDGTHLTLRERLQRHRNQEGCAKCHAGIDPWGIPFEKFDAGGRLKQDSAVDARSTLPDETEIADLNGLKAYLANDRIDQVAFSFLKHLASYAVGRGLTYNEVVFLREKGLELKPDGYRMQDMMRFVITSDLFLKK